MEGGRVIYEESAYICDGCGREFEADESGGHFTCADLCNEDFCRKCMKKDKTWKQLVKKAVLLGEGYEGDGFATVMDRFGVHDLPRI